MPASRKRRVREEAQHFDAHFVVKRRVVDNGHVLPVDFLDSRPCGDFADDGLIFRHESQYHVDGMLKQGEFLA